MQAYVSYCIRPLSQIYACLKYVATYSIVVSGGTSGTLSSWRNMHLTVVRKHRHRAGHWASASPVVKAASSSRTATITTTHAHSTHKTFSLRAGQDATGWLPQPPRCDRPHHSDCSDPCCSEPYLQFAFLPQHQHILNFTCCHQITGKFALRK